MVIPWRQAASLILLARKQATELSTKARFDYATLLLKRSPTMRFAPNASTFPGGTLDRSDLSAEWASYLSSSMCLDRFRMKNADIYRDLDHPYPGLAFRVCAIRETFEETGLLLAKTRSTPSSSKSSPIFQLSKSETDQWRKKIRQDASQFLQLCKQIQIEPDVSSLTEWCEYLAPAFAKVRFDTIFYVAILPETVSCSIDADDDETVSSDWLEPDTAINAYHENVLDFLPPQIYELSRLANFSQLTNFTAFLSQREKTSDYQTKRTLGICYVLPEAILLLLPGDDHYPSNASFDTPIHKVDRPLEDFNSFNRNRLVMMNESGKRKWRLDYQKSFGENSSPLEIHPVTDEWKFRSKI